MRFSVRLLCWPLETQPWYGLGSCDGYGDRRERTISPSVRGGRRCGLGGAQRSPSALRPSSAFFGILTLLGSTRLDSVLLRPLRQFPEISGDLRHCLVAPEVFQTSPVLCGAVYSSSPCDAPIVDNCWARRPWNFPDDLAATLGVLQLLSETASPSCNCRWSCASSLYYCWARENLGSPGESWEEHEALQSRPQVSFLGISFEPQQDTSGTLRIS